ncbi:MAG: hypothetical protein Q4C42_07010 [Clostridia bacterium]|nr:hypothetical protein [Clostridia bacterium]
MKNSLKRTFAAVMLVMTLVFGTAVPAGAKEKEPTVCEQVSFRIAEGVAEAANAQIETLVRIAQRTPRNDVRELLIAVDKIVRDTKFVVGALGYEIECEYTTYYIDGQYVDIDPIRVIDPSVVRGNGSGKK